MVMLLESTVCWFPGLSEAVVEGMREVIEIVLIDDQRECTKICNTAFFKHKLSESKSCKCVGCLCSLI